MIRGVISDGYRWVFILFRLKENGKGGDYWVTPEMQLGPKYYHLDCIESPGPDIVASILAHWVRRHLFFSAGRAHRGVTGAALL